MPTRRAVVLSAAAVLLAAPARAVAASGSGSGAEPASGSGSGSGAGGGSGERLRLKLPAPSGPYGVGTVALRLVDTARPDPWTGGPHRELMVSVRYPARAIRGFAAAPQMLPGEAAGWTELNSLGDIPADRVDWAATRTHAHLGAPAAPGPHPVVLYSPGAGDPRSLGTTLCDDLASRGHVVVMIDHTYDTTAVEFPDGRVARTVLPAEFAEVEPDPAHPDPAKVAPLLEKTVAVRVADTRFVLDALPAALPAPLRATADFARTGMFGQSAGGFTALQAMHDDRRILAAANLDGVTSYVQDDDEDGFPSTVTADGLDRPFLLVGKDGNTPSTVPSWGELVRHSRGWHRALSLHGAAHGTFTDAVVLVPQITRRLGLPRAALTENIGTIAPRRAVTADRALLAAFFGRFLRGADDHGLLDGPSARLPEARFAS
ncbi:Platelet-activating factor acetylhydrolase, isoform II [Actinacidiphila yanglinensis]|uniref:Platelet-activating factor acetylhydrolase, isoform II n=1 Tax=Actinacidiphila yanglinensis TaxID=310779 RepID=A0A1H6DA61_9ACTN|nr:hydrolase [Actinacidiphila yanglinensis]SEG81974.1 Platelet-activating factor acetylhydrolase, isoform II [Actinacidiphila yanglinensis]